jgi:lipoyl synthase
MHLHIGPEDVIRSYEDLCNTGTRVVPHILAGMSMEENGWLELALDAINEAPGDMAVLIMHIPTKGTPLFRKSGLPMDRILDIASDMARGLPNRRLVLGCMRPRGFPEVERLIMELGFQGIVQPSGSTVRWVEKMGWDIVEVRGCCAVHPVR